MRAAQRKTFTSRSLPKSYCILTIPQRYILYYSPVTSPLNLIHKNNINLNVKLTSSVLLTVLNYKRRQE